MIHPELLRPTRHPAPNRLTVPTTVPSGTAAQVHEGRVSRLPADWIHDGGLRAFRGDAGYLGRSIAALKLYLTLVVSQDAASPAGEPAPIVLSYERIAALSGLSDPLICAGKKALLDQGLVTACGERPGGMIAYRLTGLHPSIASAAILHAPQVGGRITALHGLTCRKAPNLAALKTYLLLSACGRDAEGAVSLDIDAASDLTNTSHVKIIAALAALQELELARSLGNPSRLAEQRRLRLLPLR
ncbi:hypothetical protein [Methylobacterium variabile]|jgi:hypothetical protein|uniref:hypothetical protein n=1 Tax=Methylobacterium variabile TaxID=298794 RepID=UPI00069D9CE5|nr:hypothetical protein [Methylobacterium variabile]